MKVRRPRRGLSIQWQLIIGVSMVHLVLMSIFVLDLTSRQRTFLTDSAKERILFQADVLAKSTVPHVILDDVQGLNEIVDAFSRDRTIRYIIITDPRGAILSHSGANDVGKSLIDARAVAVLKGPPRAQLLFENPVNVQAAAPITVGEQTIGWAFLGVDRSQDQAHINYVTRAGVIYTFAAVGIGAIFAIFLARTITRPLRSLLLGAKRLSQDRLDIPVPVMSTNEVGMVARAFNAAMERLIRQRTELQSEITERRRAEDALKVANASLARSNQELERFAYAVSHDLHEPLRTIKNFTSLLYKRYRNKLGNDADEFLSYIVEGAERMENLIRDLLVYSRAGRPDVAMKTVDSGRTLRVALNNLRGAIEASGASVTSADMPEITANETELVQLFQNLIGNAIKYRASDRRADIHVSASRVDESWVFEVRDNGIGIPKSAYERIFGVFQRLHGRETPGAGIGLATCTRIVERHGGRIWVESDLGVGSRFKFQIPDHPMPVEAQDVLVRTTAQ